MWLAIGFCFTALGLIGALLPIIPTVPFLLVAAFAFSRSSKRFHQWLVKHAVFGPPIRDWQQQKSISRQTKWVATLSMLAGIAISAIVGLSWIIIAIQCFVIAGVCIFIWTRPDSTRR